MIRPGINTPPPQSKTAETRMDNTKTAAKQNNLAGPGGNVAAQSLKRQSSQVAQVKAAPVGRLSLPERQPMAAASVELPTEGPAMPEPAEFDPAVFQEDMVSNMVGQIRTKQFLQSPRVQDATTSVQIKDFFNRNNPNRKDDPRSLIEQITSRMGM